MQQPASAAGPREGQCEQTHELGEALGVGEMRVLQVETTAFEAAEQGLELPAVGVGVDGFGLRRAKAGDEQEVAVLQAQGGDVDEAAPNRAAAGQAVAFAWLQRAEQHVQAHRAVPGVGHEGVALEPLVERDAVPLEPAEPVLTDELAVGQQGGDLGRAEDGEEAFHQVDALFGVGVARLIQHGPEQRHRDAAPGDAEHQEVDVGLAELPVGAVHRQPPGAFADRDEPNQQAGQGTLVDLEAAEEALQPLVVGIHLGLAAEPGGQLGQADAADLEQGQQELGEEIEPSPVPGQVLGQDGFEFLDRIVREGCHRSEKADRLAHCNHMVKLFVLYLGLFYNKFLTDTSTSSSKNVENVGLVFGDVTTLKASHAHVDIVLFNACFGLTH